MRGNVRVGDVAGQLRRCEVSRAEAKWARVLVTALDLKHAKVYAFSVHARAGAGL